MKTQELEMNLVIDVLSAKPKKTLRIGAAALSLF